VELGRANPLFPEAYYPITEASQGPNKIYVGNSIHLRCVYDSSNQANYLFNLMFYCAVINKSGLPERWVRKCA